MAKSAKALKEEQIRRDAEKRKTYAEAKDPSTNPERLKEIFREAHQREWLEEALAENPNTPLPILLSIALRHPGKVLKNPSLPLLHLENPNFLASAPPQTLESLLNEAEAPAWLLEYGSTHTNQEIKGAALKHPNLPAAILEAAIQREQNEKNAYLLGYIAQNPTLSENLLREFAHSKDSWIQRGAAKNPKTSAELLHIILQAVMLDTTESSQVAALGIIAQHPNTPVEKLEGFAKHKASEVRQGVAKNIKAPISILTGLFSDEDPLVQKALSQNPSIPLDLIESIALKKPPQHWMWIGVFSILAVAAVVFYLLVQSLRPGGM